MRKILFIFLLFIVSNCISQTISKNGKFYFSWGYNRAFFAPSTIQFTGPGYDFKIENVRAYDRPNKFEPNVYFNPTLLTIPQFNVRGGYFLTDKVAISLGYDHMKYVVSQDQTRAVYGTIDSSASVKFAGDYNGEKMELNDKFIGFEHTDGLNYLSVDIEYYDNLWFHNDKFSIDFFMGIGVGGVIPKTNAHILNTRGADTYHLAGFGISPSFGTRIYFLKHFYFQLGLKKGWLFMPNIATNGLETDRAKQTIDFYEYTFQLGALLFNTKKKKV